MEWEIKNDGTVTSLNLNLTNLAPEVGAGVSAKDEIATAPRWTGILRKETFTLLNNSPLKNFTTLMLIMLPAFSFAQFRVDAGVSLNKLHNVEYVLRRGGLSVNPAISLGYEYAHLKKIFFSSNVGYMVHGGYNHDPIQMVKVKVNAPAVWINTVGNYKLTEGKYVSFVTMGPRLNFFLEEEVRYTRKRVELGGTAGIGLYKPGPITAGVKFEYVASYYRGYSMLATAFFRLKK